MISYAVGRVTLTLPDDHFLPRYQSRWKRYDRALGEIASVIWSKYPGFSALDIGANVGDSAALICASHDVNVLCVESDESLIPFLRENAGRIGPNVSLIQGRAESLSPLVKNGSFRLVKIDTDGHDFDIILSSLDVLKEIAPVVFYEYAPTEGVSTVEKGIKSFRALSDCGYSRFVIYDNFGNFLVSLRSSDEEAFEDLNACLLSSSKFGKAIHYFDVCAFHCRDEDLFISLRKLNLELVL